MRVTFDGWRITQQQHLFPLLITLIGKEVPLDSINQALSPPPTSLAATMDTTKMGPQIRARGNISPSANGVISWAIRLKIVPKFLQLNSLQTVQHPPKEKITSGSLTRWHLTI